MWRRFLPLAAVVLAFVAGPAHAQDGIGPLGYSLDDDWGEIWRRVLDRNGRPDPSGPIQQRFVDLLYYEHEVDRMVADFPMALEYAWKAQQTGARFWIHSYDATTLGNQVQLKLGDQMSKSWTFRMQFLRHYTRDTESDLFQIEWQWRPPGRRGPFVNLRFFPRVEKQDSDIDVTVGLHDDNIGQIGLRLFALDSFSNAAYFLVERREIKPETAHRQRDPPLALALEAASVRLGGVRAEAYLGMLVPQSQRYFYGDELALSRVHKESAYLGGAMLEWKAENLPLWVGASGLGIWNDWSTRNANAPNEDAKIEELSVQARMWSFWQPRPDLRIEAQVRYSARPEERVFADETLAQGKRTDHEVIGSLRGFWMFSQNVGADLSYWHRERDADGPPLRRVDGKENRVVTRVLIDLEKLWVSFGVGWDLTPRRSVYAGGGGTFIVKF